MKKFLLIALLALISFATNAQNKFSVKNYTSCEIMVTVYCYDGCTVSSHSVLIGGTGFGAPAGFFNSGNVNYCTGTEYMVIEVCWYDYPSAPCEGEYSPMCTLIDGDPAAPSWLACPNPVSPGTYTGQIKACSNCVKGLGDGTATVEFVGGELIINF